MERAIDCLVNVDMGDVEPPEWMIRVKEDTFKAGNSFLRSPEPAELLDDMDATGVERAILLTMEAMHDIARAHAELGIVGVGLFPVGYVPPVPINDKRMYPIYTKCAELDIAVFCTSGVPRPRLPFDAQYTGLVDEVCWFFLELRFVLRHGCEPWTDLAVKLLLKWPNLYYSTSAFAPKYYPKEIVEFANTRGADKIIYAGYYPLGLTLERIFREIEDVPFRDHVWPKVLRENAITVLKLS